MKYEDVYDPMKPREWMYDLTKLTAEIVDYMGFELAQHGFSYTFDYLIKDNGNKAYSYAARGSYLPRPSLKYCSQLINDNTKPELIDQVISIFSSRPIPERSGPGRPAQSNVNNSDDSYLTYEMHFPPMKQRNVWTTAESNYFAELMLKHDLQWYFYIISTRTSKQIIQHWAKVIARLRSYKKIAPDGDIAFEMSLWPRIRRYVENVDLTEKSEQWPAAKRFSTVPVSDGLKITLSGVEAMPDSTLHYMEEEYQRIRCSQFHDIILLQYMALYYDIDVHDAMIQLLIGAQRKAQRLASTSKPLLAHSVVRPIPAVRDKH